MAFHDLIARMRADGRRMLAATGALLAAAPAAAETLDGIVPASGDCERLLFLITPEGSHAIAVDHTAEGPSGVSWDRAGGRTHRFDIEAAQDVPADGPTGFIISPGGARTPFSLPAAENLARQARKSAELVAVDERSFAYRPGWHAPWGLIDLATGERTGELPWIPPPGPGYPVQGGDRRGPWVGRAWSEAESGENSALAEPPDGAESATETRDSVIFTASALPRGVAALNVRTGVLRDDAMGPTSDPVLDWKLDRDGRVSLRLVRLPSDRKALQIREDAAADGWRTVLTYDYETLEIHPPNDFGPDTESLLVISDIGRLSRAAGRLDLATGEIAYFTERDHRGGFVDMQLSHDQSELLWESRRARSATGISPITVGVSIAFPDAPPPDAAASARAYAMTFGSRDAEALYDALRGGWGHVSVLAWTDDGARAVILLWGPDGRRRVEAAAIEGGRAVAARWGLCDTAESG